MAQGTVLVLLGIAVIGWTVFGGLAHLFTRAIQGEA